MSVALRCTGCGVCKGPQRTADHVSGRCFKRGKRCGRVAHSGENQAHRLHRARHPSVMLCAIDAQRRVLSRRSCSTVLTQTHAPLIAQYPQQGNSRRIRNVESVEKQVRKKDRRGAQAWMRFSISRALAALKPQSALFTCRASFSSSPHASLFRSLRCGCRRGCCLACARRCFSRQRRGASSSPSVPRDRPRDARRRAAAGIRESSSDTSDTDQKCKREGKPGSRVKTSTSQSHRRDERSRASRNHSTNCRQDEGCSRGCSDCARGGCRPHQRNPCCAALRRSIPLVPVAAAPARAAAARLSADRARRSVHCSR